MSSFKKSRIEILTIYPMLPKAILISFALFKKR